MSRPLNRPRNGGVTALKVPPHSHPLPPKWGEGAYKKELLSSSGGEDSGEGGWWSMFTTMGVS